MNELAKEFLEATPEQQDAILKSMTDAEKTALEQDIAGSKGLQANTETYSYGARGHQSNPINENPDVSFTTRWGTKNLGRDATDIQVMQERHPELVFEKNQDGDIVYTRREDPDQTYYRVDPKLFDGDQPNFFDYEDITDVSVPLVQGTVEGAAEGLAGIGAFLGTGGNVPATVAAKSAAGGAASMGTEWLRQKLGEWAGFNPEGVNEREIKNAGLIGMGTAAMPFLGSKIPDVGPGRRIAAQAAKQGLDPGKVGRPYAEASQGMRDWVGHKFGAEPPHVKKLGREKLEDIKKLEENSDLPLVDETVSIKQDLTNAVKELDDATWQRISSAIDEAGGVDVTPVEEYLAGKMKTLLNKRKNQGGLRDADSEELYALADLYREHFTIKPPNPQYQPSIVDPGVLEQMVTQATRRKPIGQGKLVPAAEANAIKQDMQGQINYGKDVSDTQGRINKRKAMHARETARLMRQSIEQSVPDVGGLNAQYKALQGHKKVLKKHGLVDKDVIDPGEDVGEVALTADSPVNSLKTQAAWTDKDDKALDTMLKLGGRKARGPRQSLQFVDEHLKLNNTPVSFENRAETIQASNFWMKPKKTGMDNVGTKSSARLLSGMMGPQMLMTLGGGQSSMMSGSVWPLVLGVGGGVASNLAMSPAMQRKYMTMGNVSRGFVDKLGNLPYATKKELIKESPWFDQDGGQ